MRDLIAVTGLVILLFDGWPRKKIFPSFNLGQNQRFFCAVWPWNLMNELKNNRAPPLSSFVHHFITIWEFKLELQSGKDKLGFDLCGLDLWPLTLTFRMDITSVIGNYSENFMMIQWWENSEKGMTHRQLDRQTDERTDGQAEPLIQLLCGKMQADICLVKTFLTTFHSLSANSREPSYSH